MKKIYATLLLPLLFFVSCDSFRMDYEENPGNLHQEDSPVEDDGSVSAADGSISEYDGQLASDASADVPGTDAGFYWEANTFQKTLKVTYYDTGVTIDNACDEILCYSENANLVVDMQTNSVSGVEIVLQGTCSDGSLKIYGEKKFKLTLNGLDLTSSSGPAINDQCGKRVFVHLAENTVNRLCDAEAYSDDFYYMTGSSPDDEDRKGCFFSEGNMIFSGTGVLEVEGRQKHAIASDGYFWMRPGVTIAVTGAAKNAVHVKGDADDGIGVKINGGLLYAHVSSPAGKCIKTDLDVEIAGGELLLNTSGDSEYDEDENDTSSPACIKADGNVVVSGGVHVMKSTGSGGKGINADGQFLMEGGEVSVVTTGGKYIYDAARDLTSSPKGIKTEGDVVVDGGILDISVTGVSDGSEGFESKSSITVNDGEICVYAYDDAMNAATDITFNGGRVYCYSVNNDGIDSNGTMNVNGGLVIASGGSAPEEGFDCDNSSRFRIAGGILIGTGGAAISPSSASSQRTVVYNGISAVKGQMFGILDNSGKTVLSYVLPRTMNSLSLLFSSPDIAQGETYTVVSGGSVSGETGEWNGWSDGGELSGYSQLGTFTSDSIVTTVGGSGSPSGPGGGNQGWMPGGFPR